MFFYVGGYRHRPVFALAFFFYLMQRFFLYLLDCVKKKYCQQKKKMPLRRRKMKHSELLSIRLYTKNRERVFEDRRRQMCIRNEEQRKRMRFYQKYYIDRRKQLFEKITQYIPICPSECLKESCSICLEKNTNLTCRQIKRCGHVFHSECLRFWIMRNNNSCPLCRAQAIPKFIKI